MPCDYHLLPHQGIQSLSPYVPGKSSDALALEQGLKDIIKLASNENPLGCSPWVIKAMQTFSGHLIATYAIPSIHPLRQKISNKLGVDTEMITLANGSDSLFPLFLTCFALHNDKHMLTHDYAFISYSIHAKTLGIPVISVPLKQNWDVDIDKLIAACTNKTALVFIANPNNPTGVMVKKAEVLRLLDNIPEATIVVLDEAYQEYVNIEDRLDTQSLLKKYPNLIITRTFSKAYGLAGLRMGYAVASSTLTIILQRALPPFTVNQAGLVAASVALDDEQFIKDSIEINRQGLEQLNHGLAKLNFNVSPSSGNFITFDYKKDAGELYQALQRYGIIVRPLHPYGLPNHIRVTVGTREQNRRFLEVLSIPEIIGNAGFLET